MPPLVQGRKIHDGSRNLGPSDHARVGWVELVQQPMQLALVQSVSQSLQASLNNVSMHTLNALCKP